MFTGFSLKHVFTISIDGNTDNPTVRGPQRTFLQHIRVHCNYGNDRGYSEIRWGGGLWIETRFFIEE